MTTTQEPLPPIFEPSIETSITHFVKQVHGVDIFLRPSNGMFVATFSQSSDPKQFERKTLAELEVLIAKHLLPFTGHVEAATRPSNPIGDRKINDLREKNGGDYSKIEPTRKSTVFTGIQRTERSWDHQATTIYFREEGSGVTPLTRDDKYVHPSHELDQKLYDLYQEYVESLSKFNDRFKAIINAYEGFTVTQIVDELRAQGARVGRA